MSAWPAHEGPRCLANHYFWVYFWSASRRDPSAFNSASWGKWMFFISVGTLFSLLRSWIQHKRDGSLLFLSDCMCWDLSLCIPLGYMGSIWLPVWFFKTLNSDWSLQILGLNTWDFETVSISGPGELHHYSPCVVSLLTADHGMEHLNLHHHRKTLLITSFHILVFTLCLELYSTGFFFESTNRVINKWVFFTSSEILTNCPFI